MTKELYRDIYLMITNKIEYAKQVEASWLDSMVETPEDDYTYSDCIKYVKQAHKEIAEYTALLERFESEIEEPK